MSAANSGRRRSRPLHQVLRDTLEDRDIRQKDLASRLNVSAPSLSRYLTGQVPIPDDVLAGIIRFLADPGLAEARCAACPVRCAAMECTVGTVVDEAA